MRIYSKQAFLIGPGYCKNGNTEEVFKTVPFSFQDMPDKFSEDKTFKAAVKAGLIIPYNAAPVVNVGSVNTPTDEGKAESEPDASSSEHKEQLESIEDFYTTLKTKAKEEVQKLADKYGAEFIKDDKLSENKKRVFEAYKIYFEEHN